MKYEWRKQDKNIYLPKAQPTVVNVGEHGYFTISGQGNPNSEAFSKSIGLLYSLSYAVKMQPKKGAAPEGYYEYTVFPLEGIWDFIDKTRPDGTRGKDNLAYTLMIRQPDFFTPGLAEDIISKTLKGKQQNVEFKLMSEGLCLQMLHIGSYDSEPATFAIMHRFCEDNGYIRVSPTHKEIYLNDPNRTPPEKLQTTLRFKIDKV